MSVSTTKKNVTMIVEPMRLDNQTRLAAASEVLFYKKREKMNISKPSNYTVETQNNRRVCVSLSFSVLVNIRNANKRDLRHTSPVEV